jgi:hypothetical protein
MGLFLFTAASRPALGPPSPLSNGYRGALTPEVKRPGLEADCSPPSSTEVKNAWSYTSTPYVFVEWRLFKHRDNFHLSDVPPNFFQRIAALSKCPPE